MAETKNTNFNNIAIGDIGTQLFYLDGSTFKYLVPVTAGAEFGGETESFEAPETDLDYIPKVMGRKSLNDVEYTINYTKEKYKVLKDVSNKGKVAYMEVFSDNSAMIFEGTANEPTITAGDVRQMTYTIVPSIMEWVDDIYNISDTSKLDSTWYTSKAINIDVTTIPEIRKGYADTNKNAVSGT
jgi:hypothetical protein